MNNFKKMMLIPYDQTKLDALTEKYKKDQEAAEILGDTLCITFIATASSNNM
jgi:hypothetical protein